MPELLGFGFNLWKIWIRRENPWIKTFLWKMNKWRLFTKRYFMWKQTNSGICEFSIYINFMDFKRPQQVLKHILPVVLPFELWKFWKIEIHMRVNFDYKKNYKMFRSWKPWKEILKTFHNEGLFKTLKTIYLLKTIHLHSWLVLDELLRKKLFPTKFCNKLWNWKVCDTVTP